MAGKGKRQTEAVASQCPETPKRYMRYCFVLVLAGLVVLAWLSQLSYNPLDAPSSQIYPPGPTSNAAGWAGAHLAYGLRYWLGGGAYMGLLFATAAAVILIMGGRVQNVPWRIAGVVLLITATSAAAYLYRPSPAGDSFHGGAGILGVGVGQVLQARLSTSGAWLVLVVALCIGLMLTVESLVLRIPRLGKKAWDQRSRLRGISSKGRMRRTSRAAVSTAMQARPSAPLPRPRRSRNVSA